MPYTRLEDETRIYYELTGPEDGPVVIQFGGGLFGRHNFGAVNDGFREAGFRLLAFDARGYGASDHPHEEFTIEGWAHDGAALLDTVGLDRVLVHGTSMGGMIAIVFAGKYPERTTSVAINCAAAKLGRAGRLIFKNWIDIAELDPDGPGSRILAELISWQAVSKVFLESEAGQGIVDHCQQILRDSNRVEVFTAACQAMCDMDISPWLGKITSPALVIGGDEDIMTPWDQGPDGVGQEGVYRGIEGAEKHVIRGGGHSTIFDSTDEHNRVVLDFFQRHTRAAQGAETATTTV